jgi:hypothetical protein
MSRLLKLFTAAALSAGTACAGSILVLNTFDTGQSPPPGAPGPNGPVSADFGGATTIQALGVTFSFISPTANATYGAIAGAPPSLSAQFTDPVLDGPSDGQLTFVFLSPTTFLEFDIMFAPIFGDSGGTISFDGGLPVLYSTTAMAGDATGFSAGHVKITPGSSFSQAVIAFGPADPFTMFAIDNLSYDVTTGAVANPEPAAMLLFASGALFLYSRRFTSSRQR